MLACVCLENFVLECSMLKNMIFVDAQSGKSSESNARVCSMLRKIRFDNSLYVNWPYFKILCSKNIFSYETMMTRSPKKFLYLHIQITTLGRLEIKKKDVSFFRKRQVSQLCSSETHLV